MVAIIAYQLCYTKSLSGLGCHSVQSVFVMGPRKIVAGLNTRVQLLLADMASGLVRELRRPLLRDDKRLGGNKCSLTIKHGWGKSRIEEEIRIDESQFVSLWELAGKKRVKKVRYRTPHEGMNIELDVYQEKVKGLITAEVEFPSEEGQQCV
ncbi:MAG: hypothetical protein DMG05_03580 [Acidobacteria bacterium]|nr:MAG: hypothetical protein DMG05_03580 [Acidobacteriota bacterium]